MRRSTPALPILSAFVHHYDALVGYVQRRFGCRHFAQDIVQDVGVNLLARPRADVNQPRAFLYRLATHEAIDQWRRQQALGELLALPGVQAQLSPPPAPEPHAALECLRTEAALIHCLSALPMRSQEVFSLHILHDMPQAEVARLLGISRTMVIRHLKRALHAVQMVLDDAA